MLFWPETAKMPIWTPETHNLTLRSPNFMQILLTWVYLDVT